MPPRRGSGWRNIQAEDFGVHSMTDKRSGIVKLLRERAEILLFVAVLALHLIPVLVFPYLPTQDGPSHVANALILKEIMRGEARYNQFFEIRWLAFPNWTAELLLAGAMHVLLPLAAEKALVALY